VKCIPVACTVKDVEPSVLDIGTEKHNSIMSLI